ncbi:unnamed protein product [Allacma fusca]|uniref:non-specific serine/threonine protein kinase n=1 Tax=Allacma fusca TaxID=39272 RepID=A0A8J2KA38_9HEXA|nr:unnamed protein product [Allacma fusca]
MNFTPKRIKDYDLEIDDNLDKFLRIADVSTRGTEIIPEYNLIIWLLLEKTFKQYNDLSSKGIACPEEDQVDSKKSYQASKEDKTGRQECSKAELTLAKEYAEQILKHFGIKVPFDKLTQSEKDNLFQQFSASSKLLLPDGLNGKASTIDLCEALRKHSKYREEFRVNSLIGKGSFGEVFAAELRKKEPQVFEECYSIFAIKRMPELSLDKTADIRMILNESSILKKLSGHPGIVKFYDSWLALDSASDTAQAYPGSPNDSFIFYLQMELCGVTLHQWKTKLTDKKEKPEEAHCIMILKQITEALQWIHDNNVLHLDLNPKNIFWKDDRFQSIKIGDFGLAVEGKSLKNRRGTPPYCAPEDTMTEKSDMYSVGVSLFEIAEAIITRLELASRLEKWDLSTGMPALDLTIPKLLDKNPERRPKAAEILATLTSLI